MKRMMSAAVAMLLLLTMVLSLASCSSFGTIKGNFEKAGYELDSKAESTLSLKTNDGEVSVTVHKFNKKSDGGVLDSIVSAVSTAIVYEFGSDADLQKAMSENEKLMDTFKEAQKSDYINGNCVLMTLNPDAVKIFNGTYEAK